MKQSNRSRLALLVGAAALIAGLAPAMAQEPLDIDGRWKEVRAKDKQEFAIGLVEFAPCGNNMCAIAVDAKGKCGARIVEIATAEGAGADGELRPLYAGAAKFRGKDMTFYAMRDGDSVMLSAGAAGASAPAFASRFTRAGESSCR